MLWGACSLASTDCVALLVVSLDAALEGWLTAGWGSARRWSATHARTALDSILAVPTSVLLLHEPLLREPRRPASGPVGTHGDALIVGKVVVSRHGAPGSRHTWIVVGVGFVRGVDVGISVRIGVGHGLVVSIQGMVRTRLMVGDRRMVGNRRMVRFDGLGRGA